MNKITTQKLLLLCFIVLYSNFSFASCPLMESFYVAACKDGVCSKAFNINREFPQSGCSNEYFIYELHEADLKKLEELLLIHEQYVKGTGVFVFGTKGEEKGGWLNLTGYGNLWWFDRIPSATNISTLAIFKLSDDIDNVQFHRFFKFWKSESETVYLFGREFKKTTIMLVTALLFTFISIIFIRKKFTKAKITGKIKLK